MYVTPVLLVLVGIQLGVCVGGTHLHNISICVCVVD